MTGVEELAWLLVRVAAISTAAVSIGLLAIWAPIRRLFLPAKTPPIRVLSERQVVLPTGELVEAYEECPGGVTFWRYAGGDCEVDPNTKVNVRNAVADWVARQHESRRRGEREAARATARKMAKDLTSGAVGGISIVDEPNRSDSRCG